MLARRLTIISAVLVVNIVSGDKNQQTNAWTLKYSDPSRAGRFLNIPIHYGDWVPITAAKALVEEVARGRLHSKPDQPAEKKDQEVSAAEESDRRVDHGDVVYINHQKTRNNNHRQYQTNFRHHNKPPAVKNNRRQDSSKSIRYPTQKKHIKQQKQQNRRNHKKLPPTNHLNHIGQNTRTKTQTSFPFVPSFNSLQALNPFNFFDQSRSTFTTPRAPVSQQHLGVGKQDKAYQETFNAIQTIPAPDLSKFGPGPPIIELDSGADGEIILGRPYHVGNDHDHLASFVSVDFDGFAPGDNVEKKAKKKKEKQNLSIIVEGKSNTPTTGQSDLVNFLNNDKDNAATFVISSDKAAPQGFAKIDLPFMDPTKHRGELPKAFIAPKGIAIPDGYKGKPLPQQPDEIDAATTEKVLIHQSKLDEERPVSLFDRRPTPFQRTPASNQVEIKTTSDKLRLTPTSSSLFRGSWEKNRQYQKDFLNKIKLKAREKYDKPESAEKPETNSSGKFYVNNKIKEARKEFQEQYRQSQDSTLPPTQDIIPVQNKFNIYKKVTEQEVEPTETVPQLDVISAGDYDNDPISLVFENDEVALTQSTLEQAEAEVESTSLESNINFAPTVITTTVVDTTSTLASSSDTTTAAVTTISSVSNPTTTETLTTSTTSSTTTTTTATSTTTTTSVKTENTVKVTTEDPFARLEEVRKKKYKFGKENYPKVNSYQGDLSFGDDLDTVESLSTESPPFNFAEKFINSFRTRKFGGGLVHDKNGEKFGKRIVLKKRPLWRKTFNSDNLSGSIVPTPNPRFYQRTRFPSSASTSLDSSLADDKLDEFKKKLKPNFDGFVPGPWRRPYRKPIRRSTIAPPITVDAEIYEVHPKTRLRITTQSPSAVKKGLSVIQTTTRQPVSYSLSEETDYSYQDDYVYEPTTQEPSSQAVEETTTPESDSSPPLEYQEYVPTVDTKVVTTTEQATTEDTSTDAVHETADKHTVIRTTEVSTDEPEVEEEYTDDDIENEIPDQKVSESQQIETTWNGVIPTEEHTAASTRLSSYEKNLDTSKFGDDTEYKESDLTAQVNEHGKPLEESEKATADSDTWQASIEPVRSYYEINRSDNLSPVVRIEEVEITEPKDYSEPDIIYDVTKDGFEDDSSKDSFSVPVSIAFNIPDDESTVTPTETSFTTTFAELREAESTTEVSDQTTTMEVISKTTTAAAATTTEALTTTTTTREESPETTTILATTTNSPTTTFSRSYSLINRNRHNKYEDVLLGLRGSTVSTTRPPSTTVVIDLNKSAHSVPDNLWSSFKKSLHENSTEELSETTQTSVNIEIVKELPKPSEHESEVLVVEKFPKSFGYKGKNREKWINSRRFPKPRRPFLPLAPKQNNKVETTTLTTPDLNSSEEVSETDQIQSLLTPTVSPPKSSEEVKNESAKHPLLNEIKNALYPRQKAISSIFNKQEIPTRSKQKPSGVPRGANTNIFRSFGGSKLSQAEFERSILGVSTATEISVKSMICVKGRCFNADDMGKLLPTN